MNFLQAQTAAQTLESRERLELLQSELSCLQRIHKDNMKEITERGVCITKLQAASELLRRREGDDTHTQVGTVWNNDSDLLLLHCTTMFKYSIGSVVFEL